MEPLLAEASSRLLDMTQLAHEERIAALTDRELDVLASASVWYARYHAPTIAQEAGDPGVAASAHRERYLELIVALRKLGVQILPPDGVALPAF